MLPEKKSGSTLLLAAFFTGISILLLDVFYNSEIYFSYLLVIVVLLTTWQRGKNITLISGYFASVLCIMGAYPEIIQRPLPTEPLVNHLISIGGIWLAVWFVLRSKQTDKIKNKEQEKLNALFENATEGFLITDTQGKIVLSNPAATKQFGYASEELIGKTVEELVPQKFRGGHAHYRKSYYVEHHSRSMGSGLNLSGLRKDGTEFPIEISLSSFVTEEGMFVIAFIVDITERKKDEQEIANRVEEIQNLNAHLETTVEERTADLAKAVYALEESQLELTNALQKEKDLNELKSRFVNMASHEFRTPLTSILSSVSLIEKYPSTEEQEKRLKHIDRIKSSVKNMNEILNDFLSLGKLEEGKVQSKPEWMELQSLLAETVETMQHLLKAGQNISLNAPSQEVKLFSDKNLLRNILINLLSNAIKYSDEGSIIELNAVETENEITLEVRDHGIGIPEEDKVHLFERFFRANNSTNIQGTGLGLNIVKKYAELLNGSVTFSSKENEGSSFGIRLPKNNSNE